MIWAQLVDCSDGFLRLFQISRFQNKWQVFDDALVGIPASNFELPFLTKGRRWALLLLTTTPRCNVKGEVRNLLHFSSLACSLDVLVNGVSAPIELVWA